MGHVVAQRQLVGDEDRVEEGRKMNLSKFPLRRTATRFTVVARTLLTAIRREWSLKRSVALAGVLLLAVVSMLTSIYRRETTRKHCPFILPNKTTMSFASIHRLASPPMTRKIQLKHDRPRVLD